ncbi:MULTISPECIES: hypothetical protein, partial [Serratia]
AKVSIHSDGSFEGLGCVLANTNLNVLTAVFYWFTLKRDEPFFLSSVIAVSYSPAISMSVTSTLCTRSLAGRRGVDPDGES